jgi:hypothetical protein
MEDEKDDADKNCITTSDGGCVGPDCTMHAVLPTCICGQECPVHPFPKIGSGPRQDGTESETPGGAWNRVVNLVLAAMGSLPAEDQDASLGIAIRVTKQEMALLREFVKGQ